jgi:hypothetical protein
VHHLHVDGHLAAVVADDQDADAAAARLESLLETRPQAALVNDGEVLLDIASLSHGDDGALLHVEDAVLLEDGAEHGLDNDAGSGVGDERRLLVELLGEEVDTEVAVLAGGGRGRDADDLARAALEDEDVAKADVVARDGHGVGGVAVFRRHTRAAAGLTDLGRLNTVMAVLVVVAHLGFLGRDVAGSVNGLFGDLNVRPVEGGARARGVYGRLASAVGLLVNGEVAGAVDGGFVDTDALLEGRTVGRGVDGGTSYLNLVAVVGLEAGAVFTFGNVNDGVVGAVGVVDFNARLGVRGKGSALLFTVVLLTDAGTAVGFLFTSDADLFFAEASLGTRKFGLGLE